MRKGEPSATELAKLQVNLTSDEDDRLDGVLDDSLTQYSELFSGSQAALDEHISAVTTVMHDHGWNTPVIEDHHTSEDFAGTDPEPVSRPFRETGRPRFARWRQDLRVGGVGTL